METRSVQLDTLYFGTPVALVSTCNPDGSTNLSPISSYWALDDRLMLGLGTAGRCWQNLSRHGEAVINLPDAGLWRNVEAIAATTGCETVPEYKVHMGYRHVADKFGAAGLLPTASDCIQPQRVRECPVQVEARLVRAHPVGEDGTMVAAEVEALKVHVHAALLTPQSRIDVARWQPLYYVFRHYCTLGAWLGKNFRCE